MQLQIAGTPLTIRSWRTTDAEAIAFLADNPKVSAGRQRDLAVLEILERTLHEKKAS